MARFNFRLHAVMLAVSVIIAFGAVFFVVKTTCFAATLKETVEPGSNDLPETKASEDIIKDLFSKDEKTFVTAKLYLKMYDFSKNDVYLIYPALKRTYPDDNEPSFSARALLFEILGEIYDHNVTEFIKDIYPSLPNNAAMLTNCLKVLARQNNAKSLELIANLSKQYHTDANIDYYDVFEPITDKQLKKALFDDLFLLSRMKPYKATAYLSITGKLEEGYFDKGALVEHKDVIVSELNGDIKEFVKAIEAEEVPDSIEQTWEEIQILVDLVGYLPSDPEIIKILKGAVELFPDRIAMYAATSLIRYGESVKEADMERLAKAPLVRYLMWLQLSDMKREDLFPKKYLTQYYFAEADMIQWLCHPNEYGGPPDKIELIKTKIVEDEEGNEGRAYLFKFFYPDNYFNDGAKEGWIVGISGLFPDDESELEMIPGMSVTFSHFNKLDEMTIDEHFDSFLGEE